MRMLNLSADELLSTTRSVRKRLDLGRPVERQLIVECLELAQQAPSGGNRQGASFVVVTDPDARRALSEVYRKGWDRYLDEGILGAPPAPTTDPSKRALQRKIGSSAKYLADHLAEVPVHVVPCHPGRMHERTHLAQASAFGSVLPAVWSFMLAARERGLATAWTTIHLFYEKEAAEILGIPFEEVSQVALIPLAHSVGTDFKAGAREDLDSFVHWDSW